MNEKVRHSELQNRHSELDSESPIKIVRLGDVCEQIRGVSYKPEDVQQNLTESSVPLLRANNIFEDTLNYDDLVFVNKNKVSDFQYMKKAMFLFVHQAEARILLEKRLV